MDSNSGGITNEKRKAHELGYVSTSEMRKNVGLEGLSSTWIVNNLGIVPKLYLQKGQAVYWSRDQVSEIMKGVAYRLLREASILSGKKETTEIVPDWKKIGDVINEHSKLLG